MRRVSFVVAAMLALGTASTARAQGLVVGPYAEFQTGFTVGSTVGGCSAAKGDSAPIRSTSISKAARC